MEVLVSPHPWYPNVLIDRLSMVPKCMIVAGTSFVFHRTPLYHLLYTISAIPPLLYHLYCTISIIPSPLHHFCQANQPKTSKASQPGQPRQPSCQATPPKTQVKETQATPSQPQASQAKSSLPSQPQPSQAKSSSPSQPSQEKQGIDDYDSFLCQGAVRGLPQEARPRSAGPASGPGRGPRSPAALVRPLG